MKSSPEGRLKVPETICQHGVNALCVAQGTQIHTDLKSDCGRTTQIYTDFICVDLCNPDFGREKLSVLICVSRAAREVMAFLLKNEPTSSLQLFV